VISRRLLGGLAAGVLVFGSQTPRITLGQARPQASPEEFQKSVAPVLSKSCIGCHNDRARMGNLSLQAYTDGTSALAHPEVWQKVLNKLAAGEMPPRNVTPLAATEVAAVIAWVKTVPGVSDVAPVPSTGSAGRVTARRLNRVEYNNTIRDLLGVAARPADQFPVDDSGYGFDNNGDVLSLSPLLMEKYMQAAKDISRLAVYGESLPEKPTRLVRLLNRRSPDAHDVLSSGNAGIYLPYSLRGAMYGTFTFPVDAEYEFRLRIANFRGDNDADLPDEEKARRAE
jgi:mono/diheme cytochrome c family protein